MFSVLEDQNRTDALAVFASFIAFALFITSDGDSTSWSVLEVIVVILAHQAILISYGTVSRRTNNWWGMTATTLFFTVIVGLIEHFDTGIGQIHRFVFEAVILVGAVVLVTVATYEFLRIAINYLNQHSQLRRGVLLAVLVAPAAYNMGVNQHPDEHLQYVEDPGAEYRVASTCTNGTCDVTVTVTEWKDYRVVAVMRLGSGVDAENVSYLTPQTESATLTIPEDQLISVYLPVTNNGAGYEDVESHHIDGTDTYTGSLTEYDAVTITHDESDDY